MKFWTAVKTCFQKYFDFKGRAQRTEYWWFYLFLTLVGIGLFFVDALLYPIFFPGNVTGITYAQGVVAGMASDTTILSNVFSLATLIPTFAAGARRLHDIDKSGWWQILPLAPLVLMAIGFIMLSLAGEMTLVGTIVAIIGGIGTLVTVVLLLVWLATDSDKADNRFGHSPKYGGQASAFD
ncbi:MAG: DUF805 domain-containing protein [Alphaproteobacteria bacterium]